MKHFDAEGRIVSRVVVGADDVLAFAREEVPARR
jgi:hypothetical protein